MWNGYFVGTDQVDVSQKRDHLLRQLEELKHQSLLITSICNNVKYHNARLEKYADAIVTLKRSESASLQESEKILSAVQFDIESKKEVDLERILLHRQSILEVIVEFDKRDRATLGDLLKQPEEDDDHAEKLANMMIQIKAEVLQDMQQHEANQKKIEELRNQLKDPPSAAAKGYALQSVHLHLLGILDELVPKSFDEPPTEPPTHKSNLKEELERELEHAHDSISILKGTLNKEFSTPPVDEAKLNRVLQDVTDLETLTLKLPRILRNHITKPTDPASSTPTDAIIHAARSLRNVELQLSNDHAKSQFQHAQNLKSLSEAELLSTFHRKSLESPVLATRELRDVYNVSDLATAWVEESNQKNVKNTEESRKKVDGIASRLAKIGELLERRKQLYRDVKTLHK